MRTTRTRRRASSRSGCWSAPAPSVSRWSAASACAALASGATTTRRAREAGAPAEVEILGSGEGLRVEAAQLGEQVGAHEHRGARDVEHVAHAVVLFLVELPGLDAGVGTPEPVDGPAHVEEDPGVFVLDELRPHDRRVRAVRLLDEQADRGRIQHDVVVADEQELGALDRGQGVVGRTAESGISLEPAHVGPRQRGGNPGAGVVGGPGVDHQDGQVGVVLGPEGGERRLQEGAGVPGDDHGHDGRRNEVLRLEIPTLGAFGAGPLGVGVGRVADRRQGGPGRSVEAVLGAAEQRVLGWFRRAHEVGRAYRRPLRHRRHGRTPRTARNGGTRRPRSRRRAVPATALRSSPC